MPWQRLEDPDARETRMPRLRIVLAIFLSLAAIIALWLFGAWLASRFFLH
jgi:flagellar biogenesis protein FliO